MIYCMTFIVFNKQAHFIKPSVTMSFHHKKIISRTNYTFLVKHYQNFRAELLYHEVLEQSSSRVEWSGVELYQTRP
jgi:hypothetical protein